MKFFILSSLIFLVAGDSICGPNSRFLVSVKCGNNNTYLHCAPNNLSNRTEFCNNPNQKWLQAKCGGTRGGNSVFDVNNTGCYPNVNATDFWSSYASITVNETDFCNTFPVVLPSSSLVNLGFETGTLQGWKTEGASSAYVECGIGAPEGQCYGVLSTVGTSEWTLPNTLSRSDLFVTNAGGCNNKNRTLTFFYKFLTTDYLPYNDFLTVNVQSNNGNVFQDTLDVAQVGNFGSSTWKQAVVNLGALQAGTRLDISISASVKNRIDGALSSFGYIDGVSLQ
jgi:hypothetical protein